MQQGTFLCLLLILASIALLTTVQLMRIASSDSHLVMGVNHTAVIDSEEVQLTMDNQKPRKVLSLQSLNLPKIELDADLSEFYLNSTFKCPVLLGTGFILPFDLAGRKPLKPDDTAVKDSLAENVLWRDLVSYGTTTVNDPLHLQVCHIQNLCYDGSTYIVPVMQEESMALLKDCRHCRCFPGSTASKVVNVSFVQDFAAVRGHVLIFDNIFMNHQFGHMVQVFGNHAQVLRHAKFYNLPTISKIAYTKLPPPLTQLEEFFTDVMLNHLAPEDRAVLKPPVWLRSNTQLQKGACFRSAIVFPVAGLIATNAREARNFRTEIYNQLHWPVLSCPSYRTVVLYRRGVRSRRMLNGDQVVERLKTKHRLVDVSVLSISEETSAEDQACLFGTTGLMLSSHSSQLMNMVFSNPFAAIIEIVPAMMNLDFIRNGQYLQLHFDMAIGGYVPRFSNATHLPPEVQRCHERFKTCWGKEDTCIVAAINSCVYFSGSNDKSPYRAYAKAVKHLDFFADVDAIDAAVESAIVHLNEQCGGQWPGVKPPEVSITSSTNQN